MSPDTLLKGLNFDRFTCDTTGTDPFDITLNMSGSGASQFLFKNMYIQDGTGAFRVYRSVDAVYDPAFNKWDWGNGSNLVWALADVGEVKTVIFTF